MRYPYDGQRQVKVLPPIVLASMTGGGTGGTQTMEFRVQTPDSRLQIKVSVLFAPDPTIWSGPTFDLTGQGATIYLTEEDESYGGAYSGYVPLTAVINGTSFSAPLSLPQAPGLLGYSREFVTAADAIHGYLGLNAGSESAAGQWVLQVRYQPYAQRLPDKDWEETYALCNATLISQQGNF